MSHNNFETTILIDNKKIIITKKADRELVKMMLTAAERANK